MLATLIGLIFGFMTGAIVAGLTLEHPRGWVVSLRLPEELHRRLGEEATVAGWSLNAEIVSRLQASFHQPNVVDAPGLGRD
jgi:Arc-like DNA binding domain